ncbi:MAG: hypothetical protein HUU21_31810, partial [Polyangiaceae bacterium]|nr:hypothetical protein [Polyangiaceae bacterium]
MKTFGIPISIFLLAAPLFALGCGGDDLEAASSVTSSSSGGVGGAGGEGAGGQGG